MTFLLGVILLLNSPALAQTEVKKYPNETVIFDWQFAQAEEIYISGFRIYSAAQAAGPFETLVTTALPNLRTASAPAKFFTSSTTIYYVVRPFKTEGAATIEAGDSNVVEVDLTVPTVTSLQVR
jgi:hypothetical protein